MCLNKYNIIGSDNIINMNGYKYTQTWFLDSELRYNIEKFLDKSTKNKILEIGCFEGLSTVFFADTFINDSNSSLTCVDPFLTITTNDHTKLLLNNEELNFDYNISNCKNTDKITVYKLTSDDFFKTKNGNNTYNMIYIDGCHEPDFITRDMENSFRCLEKNGIMWMDDYSGGEDGKIKHTMNAFLKKYKDQYEIIHSNYQLAIKKC
jgi:predicted O-methyltransferase YrrM